MYLGPMEPGMQEPQGYKGEKGSPTCPKAESRAAVRYAEDPAALVPAHRAVFISLFDTSLISPFHLSSMIF